MYFSPASGLVFLFSCGFVSSLTHTLFAYAHACRLKVTALATTPRFAPHEVLLYQLLHIHTCTLRIRIRVQANVTALATTPRSARHEVLLYQLLHARLALDDLAAELDGEAADAKEVDAGAVLAARQRLRGRDRRPGVACVAVLP